MKPGEPHKFRDELTARYDTIIPALGALLARLDAPDIVATNPVARSWSNWLRKCTVAQKRSAAQNWAASLPFDADTQVIDLLDDPLAQLLALPALSDLSRSDQYDRVCGPGAVFLQLVAIQHELGEDSSLDGTLLDELDQGVIARPTVAYRKVLTKMWSSIDPLELKLERNWSFEQLNSYQIDFDRNHIVYDANLDLPSYERKTTKRKRVRSEVDPRDGITVAPGEPDPPTAVRRSARLRTKA